MVSSIVSAIISFFLPGIGQILQCDTEKGIMMFIIFIVLDFLTLCVMPPLAIILFIYCIYSAYDAFQSAY